MNELRLAATLHNEGDVAGALQHTRRSIALDPDNARAHVYLGYVQTGRGDHTEAESAVRRGLELLEEMEATEGTRAEAQNILGVVLVHLERYDEAVEVLQASADDELNRTPWYALGNLGWALYEKGDLEGSKAVLTQAVGMQPRFCLGYYHLGRTHYAMESFEEADGALSAAIDADERCQFYQDAFLLRGETRARLGRSADAIDDFERCAELGTNTEAGRSCEAILDEAVR